MSILSPQNLAKPDSFTDDKFMLTLIFLSAVQCFLLIFLEALLYSQKMQNLDPSDKTSYAVFIMTILLSD